jgi:hypothetical protein
MEGKKTEGRDLARCHRNAPVSNGERKRVVMAFVVRVGEQCDGKVVRGVELWRADASWPACNTSSWGGRSINCACRTPSATGAGDYGARRRAGQRVSTAVVESTANSLVNRRMNKRQQMRWSPAGAHYLLQVRAAAFNDTLHCAEPREPGSMDIANDNLTPRAAA